jgi:hypothetical protein
MSKRRRDPNRSSRLILLIGLGLSVLFVVVCGAIAVSRYPHKRPNRPAKPPATPTKPAADSK